jgi:hypothetical protein
MQYVMGSTTIALSQLNQLYACTRHRTEEEMTEDSGRQ